MCLEFPLHRKDVEEEKFYRFRQNAADNDLAFLTSAPLTSKSSSKAPETSDKWYYFKLLDQKSLHKSEKATHDISKQALVEFLHALKNNWLEFLEHELEVKPM